jgi:hypothetical protein
LNEFFLLKSCHRWMGGKTKGFIKPLAIGWVGGV